MKRNLITRCLLGVGLLCAPLSLSADITERFCQPTNYLLGCQVYDTSGDYVVDLGNGNTTRLHLTIGAPSAATTVEDSIILGRTYLFRCTPIEATALGEKIYTEILTNASGCDSVVTLRLRVYEPACYTQRVALSKTVCAGELPYTWYGHTFDKAGTLIDTLTSSTGCDSIVTLTLNVNLPSQYAFTDSITLGENYLFNCKTITPVALGVTDYKDTLSNSLGCDSVITLTLKVYKAEPWVEPTVLDTICQGETYTWSRNGKGYTISGLYRDTLPGAVRDTAISLSLTVLEPTTGDTTATICATDLPYLWHGLEAIGDTTYTDTNVAGCDSVITLHLVINQPTTGDTTATVCATDLPYLWHGLEAMGDTTYTDTNVAGCDSVITLHLVINQPTTSDATAIICAKELTGYKWTGHETVAINGAGIYYDTAHYFATGCDSVHYTLELAVIDTVRGGETVTVCAKELPYLWNGLKAVSDTTYDQLTSNVTGCDSVATLHLIVNGESYLRNPAFELGDSAIVNPYGNRLLLLNFAYIEPTLGWTKPLQKEDIAWYRDGEADPVGTGYFYMNDDGSAIEAGDYYVLLHGWRAESGDCADEARAVYTVQAKTTAAAPALRPTAVRPAEQILVLNLDPEQETTITVYSAMGTLVATYTSRDAEQYTLRAAEQEGYYLVRVMNAGQDETLRYVVK